MNAPTAPATPKYAAYVCSGCGIGDKLDVGALEKIAQKEGKMAVVKSHPFLCNAEGVQMIRDDIVLDSSNFIEGSKSGGMFGAGSAASPLDVNRSVQSATAASLKAIQVIHKTASTEAA